MLRCVGALDGVPWLRARGADRLLERSSQRSLVGEKLGHGGVDGGLVGRVTLERRHPGTLRRACALQRAEAVHM